MAIRNDLPWDPTLVDPTDRPADGLLARFVGGRVGPLAMENGAALTFPYKKQQETPGTTPARLYTYEGLSGGNTVQILELKASDLNDQAEFDQPRVDLISSYTNGDAGQLVLGLGNSPAIVLGKPGGVPQIDLVGTVNHDGSMEVDDLTVVDDLSVGDDASIGGDLGVTGTVTAATLTTGNATITSAGAGTFNGQLTVNGLIEGNAGVDTVGGPVSLASNDDVLIAGGGSAGTVVIQSGGTGSLQLIAPGGGSALFTGGVDIDATSGSVTIDASSDITSTAAGDVNLFAGDDVTILSGGSSGFVSLNPGNQRSVTANSYPVVALRDRENAAFGTPPNITDATTGFKFQAGRQTVSFTGGAGTLTFLSAFGTGLVNVVCCAEANNTTIAPNPGGGVNAGSIALTAFTNDAAVTGNVTVSYIAFGWG